MMTYDSAYMNTAAYKSNITYIDGDKGILHYRGYPIEQLTEKSSYLEVAHPMVELIGSIAALSTLHSDAKNFEDPEV